MATQYFRITAYSQEQNVSVILDSYGMYETLEDFRLYIFSKGFEIIAASTDENFIDVNIDKTEQDEKHILSRAHHNGKPAKIACEQDGITYNAIQVGEKIYIPNKGTELKQVKDNPKENKENEAKQVSNNEDGSYVKSYYKIKDENPGAIVFYRVGDFYEVLSPDAETVSVMLNLTLINRNFGSDNIPMCGVPQHSIDTYTQKLTDCGFKVAVSEPI